MDYTAESLGRIILEKERELELLKEAYAVELKKVAQQVYPYPVGVIAEVEWNESPMADSPKARKMRLCLVGCYKPYSWRDSMKPLWQMVKKDGTLGSKTTKKGIYIPGRAEWKIVGEMKLHNNTTTGSGKGE